LQPDNTYTYYFQRGGPPTLHLRAAYHSRAQFFTNL